MMTLGAYEAKTKFSEILARVEKGEMVTITKHGVPVAQLGPVGGRSQESVSQAVDNLRRLRQGARLEGVSIRELIEEGRL